MESKASLFNKRIVKLGRDIKKWKVWEANKDKIDQFRKTLPLIQDLKNPALRDRHWRLLREEMGKEFDQK
jgi:dynein heavy chain